ncbi:alpha-crystallin A chain-like [Dermacentor variabilis]|uniref:alpha-crystallin A chain-like n=1 Tax=Dermacentor variabilis TaxID=34621 RepID=UPI003F5C5564
MSLFPLINRGSWGPSDLARRFFDEDDVAGSLLLDGEMYDPPFYHQRYFVQPRRHLNQSSSTSNGGGNGVCSARQQSNGTTAVACSPDKFAVRVDTRHFAPDEISVKTRDHCVVVHGKHEEKSDDRGCYVKREFTRRYVLPEDVDPESVECHMTHGGLLSLEAPRKKFKRDDAKPIPIKVQHEGGGDASTPAPTANATNGDVGDEAK